jgi:hypothetical protein
MNTIVAYFNIEHPCFSHAPGHRRLLAGGTTLVNEADSNQEKD